jgi:hypothetical protein
MQRVNLNIFNTADVFWPQALPMNEIFYHFFKNILTVGYEGTCVSLNSQREIQKIEIKEESLRQKAIRLNDQWNQLEGKWWTLVEEFMQLRGDAELNIFKGKITSLSKELEIDHLETCFIKREVSSHYFLQVLKCIAIWIANVATLGLYGLYQKESLKRRLHAVQEQESQLNMLREHNHELMQQNLNALSKRCEEYRQGQGECNQVCRSEKGLVVAEIGRLKREKEDLKAQEKKLVEEQEMLANKVTAVRMQRENLRKQIEDSKRECAALATDCKQHKQVCDQLAEQYESQKKLYCDLKEKIAILERAEAKQFILKEDLKKIEEENQSRQASIRQLKKCLSILEEEEQELRLEIDQMKNQLRTLYQELEVANKQAHFIKDLKQEKQSLKDVFALHSLQSHLEPIAPPYRIRDNVEESELNQIRGAVGIRDFRGKERALWSDYAKRYNDLSTAYEIFQAGVMFALQLLYRMALQEPKKIQLPPHWYQQKLTEDVLYNCIALDLIEGGQPEQDACAGYVLWLNNKNMKMHSADPMKGIEDQQIKEENPLQTFIFYRKRDEFTPSEKLLAQTSAATGIYPVEAKCLWVRLTDEEKTYLFYSLIGPVRRESHSDHQHITDCTPQLSPESQQRIDMLRNLIAGIGIALKLKFGRFLTWQDWKGYIDRANLTQIIEQYDDQHLMCWKYDDYFLRVRENDNEQQQLIDLLLSFQRKYQTYLDHLKSTSFVHSMNSVSELERDVTKEILAQQYYIVERTMGGQGVLFPNLLALLMPTREQVNVNNLMRFREAVAAYLDHPQNAQRFAQALEEEHHCRVEEYKEWLRCAPTNHQFHFLSRVQIEIVAYALGIRIAVFTFSGVTIKIIEEGKTKLCKSWKVDAVEKDKYGRIVPIDEYKDGVRLNYFGPSTRETLFLAASKNAYHVEGQLYGLFPKLTESQLELIRRPQDLACIQDLQNSWKEMTNP